METVDDWEEHWGDYASTAQDNPAQAYRRRLTFDRLGAHGAPLRLVDVGSGQGDLLREVALEFPAAELLGIELSAAGIAASQPKVPAATFVQRNLLVDTDIPAPWRSWATHAVCSEVLEHVDRPDVLLRNARSYMAPGCHLVVTVPAGPRSAFDKHIGHRRHFTKHALADVLADSGFADVTVWAAGFPTFNLYKLLTILRGKKLIDDVRGEETSRAAEVAQRAFTPLFRIAMRNMPLGWQLIATARLDGSD
jgi:2-polyprenyl-3-methyl-5-hydroxy-6-metoxy-1,4-benzoquinol methylase